MRNILLLILFSLFSLKALFQPGYFTSHDGWHQVVRLHYFNQAVGEGILVPSYISNLYYGYGYPLFIFNYQLPWYIGVLFMTAGKTVFEAIKDVYIVGFVLSALTMYYYLRSSYSTLESFAGSLLYIWTPYRFSNIFVRGATGEATIFMFIPLLLMSVDKIIEKKNYRYLTLGAFAITAMIISHAIVALLVITSIFIYSLLKIFISGRYKNVINIFLIYVSGLLLSSFYLLPAYILKNSTVFNQMIQNTSNDGQFVEIGRLIYSKWGYAFANSIGDGMSFQVGIANWIVIILSLFIIFIFYLRRRYGDLSGPIAMLILFIVSIFMITPQSEFIWRNIVDKFFFVDFHWRLLSVTVVASSILTAFVISSFKKQYKFLIFFLIVILAMYTNRNHLRVNQYSDTPLSLYLESELTTNTYDEYFPKWANKDHAKEKRIGGILTDSEGNNVAPIMRQTDQLLYEVNNLDNGQFTAQLFYFPGWSLYIDGNKSSIEKNSLGLIQFTVPAGLHKIDIKYTGTNLMLISKFISVITALMLLSLVYLNKKNI